MVRMLFEQYLIRLKQQGKRGMCLSLGFKFVSSDGEPFHLAVYWKHESPCMLNTPSVQAVYNFKRTVPKVGVPRIKQSLVPLEDCSGTIDNSPAYLSQSPGPKI